MSAAPFSVVPQRLDSAPEPEMVRELFSALDQVRASERELVKVLDGFRQQHMVRTRCWGLDLTAYRREIEGRG